MDRDTELFRNDRAGEQRRGCGESAGFGYGRRSCEFQTVVNFPKSGWIAARRMGSDGHQVHTAAVFVIVNNAPIRASAADAQFYVQWMDTLLTKTSPGGPWNSFFPTSLSQAQARYQAAKTIFQQIAAEAAGPVPFSVTATTPASGASGVNTGTAVNVTFNNALDATTINAATFTLRDAGNTIVSASYNVSGNTATLTPSSLLAASTTYTATVATGVKDINGNTLAANYTWSFSTPGAVGTACTSNCTIWPVTAVPGLADQGPDGAVELGVKFRADANGTITGIRFYKASANTGTHVGNLWSGTGQLLASVTFSGETASGWQQMNFAAPVSITANTDYVASYHVNAGHYSQDGNYFATTGVDNAPLHALRDGISGFNGVYAYGAASAFPSQGFNSSNYWVDVVFNSGPAPTLTSIAVTPVNPAIPAGSSQQFTATGTYSNGSTQNITSQVTWTSSSTGVASINTSGLATGVAAGTSTISAAQGAVSGSAALTVQSAPLTVTTSSLSSGLVGTTYSATLAASGGASPYTWSITTGSLPSGLTLSPAGTITGTPAVAGTSTFTVQARDAATPAAAATKSLSITIASQLADTGFLAPSASAPVSSSAGDNNGFETNPVNAFAFDGVFAVDANSGTNSNTSCTNTGKDRHIYSNYNVSLPVGVAIRGIEVRLDAKVSSTANAPKMCVQLSWDGGTSWTAAQSTATLTTTTATYMLGTAADTWGRAWTVPQLVNSAFRVRITNVASSTARTFSLDGVAVRVTYQ